MIQKPFAAYIRMRGFGGLMRRQLAAAFIVSVLGSTTVSAANDFPYGQTLAFNAYRNGQEIGRHTLSFQQDGPNRVVMVAINFGVKAMGITAYRYIHSDRECGTETPCKRSTRRLTTTAKRKRDPGSAAPTA